MEEEKRKEVLEILLKEYAVMRSEIRMYINKQYLALTAILAILTTGVFKSDSTSQGTTFIWIPFVVAAIICFMAMVTFFINRNAGYVRLIEWRINQLFDTVGPAEKDEGDGKPYMAPMLWENYYADIGMDRDKGNQLTSVFGVPVLILSFAGLVALGGIVYFGFHQANRFHPQFGWVYLGLSIVVIIASLYALQRTNTGIRKRVVSENEELSRRYKRLTEVRIEK